MRVALALCLLAGCDFIFRIDRIPNARDASITDDAPGGPDDDALVTADVPQSTACDTGAVAQILVGTYRSPSLTPDKLQLFMTRLESDNQHDIYLSLRGSENDAWGGAQKVPFLSSSTDDLDPAVWMNGTQVQYISSRSGTRLLWQASRPTPGDQFISQISIGTANTNFTGFDISPDGLTLYADDGLNNALSKATRTTTSTSFGAFGTIYNGVGAPSLTGNGLVIYYHRAGNIYRATRSSTVGGFSNEQRVTDGSDPDISEDGTLLVYKNAVGLATIPCTP